MKKLYTLLFAFFGLFLSVNAAYLKNVPQKLTQPNGVIIHCFASGDEYHNWLHDSLGYTIIRHPHTGYYVYALQSGGNIVASEYIVGRSNPTVLPLMPHANISIEKRMERRAAMEVMEPKKDQKSSNINHGHVNNLVFFIRFSDEDGFQTDNYTTIEKSHNDSTSESSNSMYNFYKQASYGKFTVTTSLYPSSSSDKIYSYQDIHPRNYFLAQDSVNPEGYADNDERRIREHDLLMRVVNFFADSIPTTLDLDFNNDGYVDNVCFITSGSPEGWNGLMWPHRWVLTSYDVRINGKRVYDYNFIMETYTYVGVITHEFMHTLGAPDLYRYYTDVDIHPVGKWDLMASTNYAKPQGLSAFMKWKYGNWIDTIHEITTPGTYTLYPANGTSPHKSIYKISTSAPVKEYIVLDYRSMESSTFESVLPGSGLLIYRIDSIYRGNAQYDGKNLHDEVYVYRPNGSKTNVGDLDQAHFSQDVGRTHFDTTSNPSPFYSNEMIMHDIVITNISAAGDSIQFTFQRSMDYFLTVDSNLLTLEYHAEANAGFNISSNTDWEIDNVPDWLNLSASAGTGNATITISAVNENRGTEDSCVLTLYTTDQLLEEKITVHRSSYPLLIDKDSLFLGANQDDTTSFMIKSRMHWTINKSADWLTLSQNQGDAGTYNIVVTVDENSANSSRSGSLTLSSDSLDITYTIAITQDKGNAIIKIDEAADILLFPNPVHDVLNVHFSDVHPFTEVSIYTVYGELVYTSSISTGDLKINTAHLASGVYMVKFNSSKGVAVRKLLVQ